MASRLQLETSLSVENVANGTDASTPTKILPVSGTPGVLTIGVATSGNLVRLTVGLAILDGCGSGGRKVGLAETILGMTCGWIWRSPRSKIALADTLGSGGDLAMVVFCSEGIMRARVVVPKRKRNNRSLMLIMYMKKIRAKWLLFYAKYAKDDRSRKSKDISHTKHGFFIKISANFNIATNLHS